MSNLFGIYQALTVEKVNPWISETVKITYPWLASSTTAVARISKPFGPASGPPIETNASVFVMFEAGNVNLPVVIGIGRR